MISEEGRDNKDMVQAEPPEFPETIFAPSDASLRTCFSFSFPNLLREHIVPGLFTIDYMRRLSFGTKIETLSPGRCITVTSDSVNRKTSTTASAKVFFGGVEITQPDLFNNGMASRGHVWLCSWCCLIDVECRFSPSENLHLL
ncbi:hypothetical protein Ahy_A09g041458 [Arachis hypogaea]|uniref:FAS1 domain-containing protein n=1 Tax=Arachis hypogaea TaxID=3818 RepID=A0A445BCV2_ARAHY|nr:hypothetical protein Ahy_A09g041458 [Arachis hypogaea]